MTMTHKEILALLPKHEKPALDHVFYRDLCNHWAMFGAAALVRKLKGGWTTDFRGHGHPTVWKTKRQAMEMADAWVLSASRDGLKRA